MFHLALIYREGFAENCFIETRSAAFSGELLNNNAGGNSEFDFWFYYAELPSVPNVLNIVWIYLTGVRVPF